jgi:hypothetical protein
MSLVGLVCGGLVWALLPLFLPAAQPPPDPSEPPLLQSVPPPATNAVNNAELHSELDAGQLKQVDKAISEMLSKLDPGQLMELQLLVRRATQLAAIGDIARTFSSNVTEVSKSCQGPLQKVIDLMTTQPDEAELRLREEAFWVNAANYTALWNAYERSLARLDLGDQRVAGLVLFPAMFLALSEASDISGFIGFRTSTKDVATLGLTCVDLNLKLHALAEHWSDRGLATESNRPPSTVTFNQAPRLRKRLRDLHFPDYDIWQQDLNAIHQRWHAAALRAQEGKGGVTPLNSDFETCLREYVTLRLTIGSVKARKAAIQPASFFQVHLSLQFCADASQFLWLRSRATEALEFHQGCKAALAAYETLLATLRNQRPT